MSNVHVCPDPNCWHRRVAEAPTGAFDGMWPSPRIVGLPPDEAMADVCAWNDLTARAERAEAAIQRVRGLAAKMTQQVAQLESFQVGNDPAFPVTRGALAALREARLDLLAALDSTDPVEAAPKERT